VPPPSPLPLRHGLQPAWVRTPNREVGTWDSMGDWLHHKLAERVEVDRLLAEGRFVYADARPVTAGDAYAPYTFIWFHRDLRDEPEVPGEVVVLHQDERIVVVDKPPFLSSIPRGNHVLQSVVVRMREALGLPELSPAHRLDRITSGVLVLTTEQRWRAAYQGIFADGTAQKTYRALAPWREDLQLPLTIRNHIQNPRDSFQVEIVPDAPVNAETRIELAERQGDLAVYRLLPRTGRTHQLRKHLHDLGIPIVNDPIYPEVLDVSIDDFSHPLQLLADELSFIDPVDGTARQFRSARGLPLTAEA
jgi:tRNA pseudouridine32 synthase/23S rRNA pseudouridine746 synthase